MNAASYLCLCSSSGLAEHKVTMEDSELSEGEVMSDESGNEAQDSGPEPGPEKKQKLDAGERPSDAGKTKISRRKWKKQKKKSLKMQQKQKLMQQKQKVKTKKVQCSKPVHEALNKNQVVVLKALVQLSKGQSPDIAPPQTLMANFFPSLTLKTRLFQKLILHLLVGAPPIRTPLEGSDVLREKKIVVIWLSMVSAKMFTSPDLHFTKLKSLHPSLQFIIEHPGSARFVKLGIEAFLLQAGKDEDSSTKGGQDNGELTRANCLLSLTELRDNAYPIPPLSPQEVANSSGKDLSDYCRVTDWPSDEVANLQRARLFPLFAVDCEMVETKNGLELARVSIVDESLKCVYDQLVKPECPIIDYNTRFSGIDEDTLKDVTTTLSDVQTELVTILPSDCILVGHSLENDFHVLKLMHPYVIDTSCLFTPYATPLSKPSLRMLASKLLSADIQVKTGGHNSVEDASACMKLVLLKLKKGASCTVLWNEDSSRSILTEMKLQGRTTGIVDKVSVVNLFGTDTTLRCVVTSDEAATESSRDVISQCDFTFIQLHAMETLLKSEHQRDPEKQKAVMESLDSDVISVVEGCPRGTLVLVVCGSNDIREVKKLQKLPEADEELQRVVKEARTGLVVAFLVN